MKRACPAILVALLMVSVPSFAQVKPKPAPKPAAPAAAAAPAKPVPAPAPAIESPVDAFLKTRALEQTYNPVLLNYLLEEGRPRLTPAQHKAALDQMVVRFKAEIDIKPSSQVTASLATVVGALAGGVVGEGVAQGAGSVWAEWVDAANLLVRAGYPQEALPFLENCVKTNPYPVLRSRCTVGLAAANPERALTILTGLLDKSQPEEVINTSLRMLGDLAGTEGLPAEQKDAAIKELIARTQGMMNNLYYVAAIDGLARSKDPRGIEPIRKLNGATKGTEVQRAAKRALLIDFKDSAIVEVLRKDAKGGFMKTDDDRFFAAALLIEAGDDGGFAYAQEQLTKKKGGFLSSKNEVDYRPDLVRVLVTYGGQKAVPVLQAGLAARKPDEWLRAFTAIGLLELGDKTGIEDARKALAVQEWANTRMRATEALAKHGDLSGVASLKSMLQDPGLLKKFLDVIGNKAVDRDALCGAIAGSLGRINQPDVVPLLTSLIGDKSDQVRLAAAYAVDEGRARTPEVAAHLLRTATERFPGDPRTKALLDQASKSEMPTVRFLALVASRP
jgi:HEAT repeat protein